MMPELDELERRLDQLSEQNQKVRFWLRDDDASTVTQPLETLLALINTARVPALIAAIPATCDASLASRIAGEPLVSVGVHGCAHTNHAPPSEKKTELGDHRPIAQIIGELVTGREALTELFGGRLIPILVPPWNRIAPTVSANLGQAGYKALSTFGPETDSALPMVNTHVDLIDWRGGRTGKGRNVLLNEISACIDKGVTDIGILTHHLVHDNAAWAFLEWFLAFSADHPAMTWVAAETLMVERAIEPHR